MKAYLMPGADLRLIREGLCPHGHGPLERRDDYGWCAECSAGWSITASTFAVHFEFEFRQSHA